MDKSPWSPAWTPKKQEEEDVSPDEARRRVAQHVQEAKIALELDKQERKSAASMPLENQNDGS